MLPQSCWALLLLCTTARSFGWLGFSNPKEVRTPPSEHFEVTPGDEQLQDEASRRDPSAPDSSGHQEPVLDETLISSEQHRLAQLMEDITQRMERVSIHEAPGHRIVLSNDEQQRAQDASSKREGKLDHLLAKQHHLEELMETLQKLNESLVLILAAVKDAQNQLENHLQHVHSTLNPHGQSSSVISTCILYVSYFMLLVALLVPTLPRVAILLLFLISSALSGVLSIPELSSLLALALAGQWLVAVYCGGAVQAPWMLLLQEEPHHWLTSTPNRQCEMELLQEELDRMEMSCLQEPSPEQSSAMAQDLPSTAGHTSPIHGGWRTKLSSRREMLKVSVGTGKHREPKPCSPSKMLSSDMSLLSPWSLCQGLTRAGQRCRKKAIPGQDFCHAHAIG